jgi:hypothetical protein
MLCVGFSLIRQTLHFSLHLVSMKESENQLARADGGVSHAKGTLFSGGVCKQFATHLLYLLFYTVIKFVNIPWFICKLGASFQSTFLLFCVFSPSGYQLWALELIICLQESRLKHLVWSKVPSRKTWDMHVALWYVRHSIMYHMCEHKDCRTCNQFRPSVWKCWRVNYRT